MPSFEDAMFFKPIEFIGPKRKDGVKKTWHNLEFSKENNWTQNCPSGMVREALRFPTIFKVHNLTPDCSNAPPGALDELITRVTKLEHEVKAMKMRNGKDK